MSNWPWRKQSSELFAPKHWERVLSGAEQHTAAEAPSRNRKAERLWSAAHDAWARQDLQRSKDLFTEAVLEEPALADGYLGLFAIGDGFDEQICQALAVTADGLREYQRRLDKKLVGFYYPLLFEPVQISSPDDARLAFVRYLSKTGQFTAAAVWLARCNASDTRTMALKGQLALDEGHFEEAVEILQKVAELDEQLRCDAHLGLAIALEELGMLEGARLALLSAAKEASNDYAQRYSRYRLALVHEALGEAAFARKIYEQLYMEDVHYLDVAARLGRRSSTPATAVDALADPFTAIVAELEAGRLATGTEIADNHPQL